MGSMVVRVILRWRFRHRHVMPPVVMLGIAATFAGWRLLEGCFQMERAGDVERAIVPLKGELTG